MDIFTQDLLFSRDSSYNKRKYIPLHYHNENEIYLLLKGEVKYFVDDKTFLLNEGDLMIIPAGVMHSTDTDECLYNERLLISFHDDIFFKNIIPCLNELFKENIIHLSDENRELIKNIFYKIESEFKNERKNKEILIKLYISELIIHIHRHRIKNAYYEQNTDKLILQIKQYINLNFANDITLAKLSKVFGLTETYLSRRFKSSCGICISEYLNYIRVDHAEKLLKTEKMPITEIAMECGFNDSSYFSYVFKKLKGITPYKYSKLKVSNPKE